MNEQLEKNLKFVEEVNKFKFIERIIWMKWLERYETDAEHSWHLAIFVMVLAPFYSNLDVNKCIKLALIHDLPEIYAWDCPPWTDVSDKNIKEAHAIKLLLWQLWDSSKDEFEMLFNEYEIRSSREARFVYELDKIIPWITCYLCEWLHLKKEKLDYRKIATIHRNKVSQEFWFDEILKNYISLCEQNWYIYEW